MTNLSDNVPARDVCEKLKEAGMPQRDTACVWEHDTRKHGNRWKVWPRSVRLQKAECLAAPTVQEMLEMMISKGEREGIAYELCVWRSEKGWQVVYTDIGNSTIRDLLPPDPTDLLSACVSTLLWLANEGYL